MTLLVNEIYVRENLLNSLIVFAADRRIIQPNGKIGSNRKKIFRIPMLNAGVGYYGLAQVNDAEYFSSWVPNFIKQNTDVKTIGDFAERLCLRLNQHVSKRFLLGQPSGFHVCGYNGKNYPEFWVIRNHKVEGGVYKDFKRTYYPAAEEFLKREAVGQGFDGVNPSVKNSFNQYYVNGDILPFHTSWFRLGEFLGEMFAQERFKTPRKPDDLEEIAKWKIRVIASFYNQFAHKKLIGNPPDAFVLKRGGATDAS